MFSLFQQTIRKTRREGERRAAPRRAAPLQYVCFEIYSVTKAFRRDGKPVATEVINWRLSGLINGTRWREERSLRMGALILKEVVSVAVYIVRKLITGPTRERGLREGGRDINCIISNDIFRSRWKMKGQRGELLTSSVEIVCRYWYILNWKFGGK